MPASDDVELADRQYNTESGGNKKRLPNGFATVTNEIVKDRDHGWQIYKRFDRLATRNLLYLQGKLSDLEQRQAALDENILTHGDTTSKEGATSWQDLAELARIDERKKESEMMSLTLEIQRTLQVYHDALRSYNGVLSLSEPAPITLKGLKSFRTSLRGTLRKESSHVLDDETDLVALGPLAKQDRLTAFVLEHCAWLFTTDQATPEGTAYVRAKTLARIVTLLSVLLAAVLLIGAVAALNYAPNQKVRLALVATFTIAFASTVVLLSSAGRSEVFVATAAYAAVLVVFIGGTGSAGRDN